MRNKATRKNFVFRKIRTPEFEFKGIFLLTNTKYTTELEEGETNPSKKIFQLFDMGCFSERYISVFCVIMKITQNKQRNISIFESLWGVFKIPNCC